MNKQSQSISQAASQHNAHTHGSHVGHQPSSNPSKLNSFLKLFLKSFFVIGLLYFLIQKGFISVQATSQALQEWPIILPAIGALFVTSALGVIRWQWLLQAQNVHLPWSKTFQLTYIGTFFNIALPGAVSGDFVKAFYVGQILKGQKSKVFGTILLDRVAGLSALVLVSAGALAFGFRAYNNTPLIQAIQFMMMAAAGTVIIFYGYLFLVREHHDPALKLLRYAGKRLASRGKITSLLRSITSIYEGIRHYHNHRLVVVRVLAISMLIHLIIGWCCLNFAIALQENHLSLLGVYIVAPLGLLVTAIPVAPAGVGTGNFAFLHLFNYIGSDRGADVYSLYALTNMMIGMFGGIIYLRYKAVKGDVKLS